MERDEGRRSQPADADEYLLPLPVPAGEPARSMRFRRIPAGAFRMGARSGVPEEEPVHRVEVPYEFWLGTYVVSQAEYAAVVRGLGLESQSRADGESWVAEPSHFAHRPDHPVENVSWRDAALWCQALTGELQAGGHKVICRLPTQIEWEYACRAGTETEYWCGDDESDLAKIAWFGEDVRKGGTHPVHSAPAANGPTGNGFGLAGMHGNVWEWCQDGEDSIAYRRLVGGAIARQPDVAGGAIESELASDRLRVIRGGAWLLTAERCRSAFRFRFRPDVRYVVRGFRVCLVRGPAASQEQAGGGAAPAKGGAEGEQAEPDKAGGARPQSGAAGETVAAAIAKRPGGRVVENPASDEGQALLDVAAGRSPAADAPGGVPDAVGVPSLVIGDLERDQDCGHSTLDFRSFTSLTHLCLWSLGDLEEIAGLPESLERLDLRGCRKLRSIPGVMLPRLETLDLGECVGLPALPQGLEAPALRWLHLDDCTGIEDGQKTTHAVNTLLQAATSLEELTLFNCRWLGSLLLPEPSEDRYVASIGDPRFPERHLKKLVLPGCTGLKELPNLAGYPWLHHLDLRGCSELKEMPRFHMGERDGRPIGLRTLYATGCDKMRTFRGLDIRRVHRGESTAAIGESAAAGEKVNVAGQFRTLSTLADDPAELRMAKVLFLGSGRCGKTTVSKALPWVQLPLEARRSLAGTPADPTVPQESTLNIRLEEVAFAAHDDTEGALTTVHIWDFGGQEIYHNTHRLFASEGAVFVIVTTHEDIHRQRVDDEIARECHRAIGKTEEEYRDENTYRELDYWLDYVWDARGLRSVSEYGTSERTPRVVIVMTGPARANVASYLGDQAGRYRSLLETKRISVYEVDIDKDQLSRDTNPVESLRKWVAAEAVAAADDLGIRMPRLYAAMARWCSEQVLNNATEGREAEPIETLVPAAWHDQVRVFLPNASAKTARSVAGYLHACGRVFFPERFRDRLPIVIDQAWAVELVYRLILDVNGRDKTRATLRNLTRTPFPWSELISLYPKTHDVQKHGEFLHTLLEGCDIILDHGGGKCVAIHPPLLGQLDARLTQHLVEGWSFSKGRGHGAAGGVNHSFAIHSTPNGLTLGRNAFQRVVASLLQGRNRELRDFLFFGESRPDDARRQLGSFSTSLQDVAVWDNGFQISWLMERRPDTGDLSEVLRAVDVDLAASLTVRMEWVPSVVTSRSRPRESFRGGIFVQMLCSDEATMAERLREVLFGRRDTAGRLTAPSRAGLAPPLGDYSFTLDPSDTSRDLVLHDFRPEELDSETARCLRGFGQPGWAHENGPKNGGRFDVAISYRRKASEPFVKAMFEALSAKGILAYYDRERMMDNENPTPATRAPNTLDRIYDTLRQARLLIIVPSEDYFAPPVSQPTHADNIFCPVELAEAVVADRDAAGDRSLGEATRVLWVAPSDGKQIIQAELHDSIMAVLQGIYANVVYPRRAPGKMVTAVHRRENESVDNAVNDCSGLLEWIKLVTHGTDQYLIAPRQPDGSGQKWDFSAIVERIDAALRRP